MMMSFSTDPQLFNRSPGLFPGLHGLPHDSAQRQRHGAALGAALVRQRQAAQQPVPRQRSQARARHGQGALQGPGAGALRFASEPTPTRALGDPDPVHLYG